MAHTYKDQPPWAADLKHPRTREWHAPGCTRRPDLRLAHHAVLTGWSVEASIEWRRSPTTGEPYPRSVERTVPVYEWTSFERPCDLGVHGGRCHRYLAWWRGSRRIPFDPQRASSRDLLRSAARDYNGRGESDIAPLEPRRRLRGWDD